MWFLRQNLISCRFLVRLSYSFLNFSLSPLQNSQLFVIFFFSNHFDSFLIWLLYSSYYTSFSSLHYLHGTFFYIKFNSYIIAVYSCCFIKVSISVVWVCRIDRLHLCRGVRLPQQVSWDDTKQSDSEAPVMMKLWGMRSTTSLPSLPGPLCDSTWDNPMYWSNRTKLFTYVRLKYLE